METTVTVTSALMEEIPETVRVLREEIAHLRIGDGVSPQATAVVGKVLAEIGALLKKRAECFKSETKPIGCDRRTMIASCNEAITTLIKSASSVVLPNSEEGKRLRSVLRHYRVKELNDDGELTTCFDEAREEYRSNPQDGSVCVRYGWILHDCLSVAIWRLRNVKLVQFFAKAFEDWSYQGSADGRDNGLEDVRKRDLNQATKFLSGPREALERFAAGQWADAATLAERYLESNPGDVAAIDVAVSSYEKMATGESWFNLYNLCVKACRWHPREPFYQKKLVTAAERCYWTIREAALASAKNASQIMLVGCQMLFDETLAIFDSLVELTPGSSYYSKMLSVVTAAASGVAKYGGANAELKTRVADSYCSFVLKWGIRNFRDEDRNEYFGNKRHSSLVSRVVLMLCKSLASYKGDAECIMRFVKEEERSFRHDHSRYEFALSMAFLARGDMEEFRRHALALVRINQTEAWRWRVLSKVYPRRSEERQVCLQKANQCEQKLSDILDLERMTGDHGEEDSGYEENLQKSYAETDRRAEALLMADAESARGIVLAWFTDRARNVEVIRVWWRDARDGRELVDFVELNSVDGLEMSAPGTPVLIKYVKTGEKCKVVRISANPAGAMWEDYPFEAGIVIRRDEGRRHVKIMYAKGRFCSVNFRRLPSADLPLGNVCQIAVFERHGLSAQPLCVRNDPGVFKSPDFVREYNGRLERMKGTRDAKASDVIVRADLKNFIRFGQEVSGLAIDVAVAGAERSRWIAVTCQKQEKNLEVLR